ncbi:hypothetical protein A5844_000040 [Enterococcus sp. 10A9_DIV0425]|uniref:ECF transporter S component n=1 Tax=Candidatus Enterococcus wittei TaxID=1987383 RepID=A0A2C9XQY4_9ENTE|nr:ECF transporter S component [Enterococcus sp. 10A9_DIV0425]OTP11826.1 hypothetical protein A5844_000040 [Enterococcus sp. 10A9_DIV0425]
MNTRRITIYAMLTALTVAISLVILIPIPGTNGFITLCEAGIYTTASLFGPLGGLVVGASSGLFIDLLSGYPQWAFFSLIIHGLQGLVVGYFANKGPIRLGLGLTFGTIIMMLGYFFAGWFLYDWPAGVASLPSNLIQNIAGILLAVPLTRTFMRFDRFKQFRM